MQSNLSWIMTNDGGLSIIALNRHFTVARDHQNFAQIKDAIRAKDPLAIIRLIDIQAQVREYVQKTSRPDSVFNVEVKNGCIYINDYVLDNELARRTKMLMEEGLPFEHMVLFLKNVLQNPSYNSQKQLFRFLSNHKLPITDDGCFLAYKGVRDDWTDRHSGKFNNAVGATNEMPRYCVDDNPANDCSHGFHIGTIDHARSFGSGGHIIIVKIDPKDVVSVPNSNTTKLRCCKYTVVSEYGGDLEYPIYNAPIGAPPMPVTPVVPGGWGAGPTGAIDPSCDAGGCSTPGAQATAIGALADQLGVPPAINRDGAGTRDPDDDDDDEDLNEEFEDEEEDLDDEEEDEDEEDEHEYAEALPVDPSEIPPGTEVPVAEILHRPPATY